MEVLTELGPMAAQPLATFLWLRMFSRTHLKGVKGYRGYRGRCRVSGFEASLGVPGSCNPIEAYL